MILLLKSYPYHFVRTILSMSFCPILFCPYTILSIPFYPYHFVRYHFVLEPNIVLWLLEAYYNKILIKVLTFCCYTFYSINTTTIQKIKLPGVLSTSLLSSKGVLDVLSLLLVRASFNT